MGKSEVKNLKKLQECVRWAVACSVRTPCCVRLSVEQGPATVRYYLLPADVISPGAEQERHQPCDIFGLSQTARRYLGDQLPLTLLIAVACHKQVGLDS